MQIWGFAQRKISHSLLKYCADESAACSVAFSSHVSVCPNLKSHPWFNAMAGEVVQSWHQIWDFDQLGSRFQRLSSKNGTRSQNKRTIAVLETFCEKRNRRWSQFSSGQRCSPCVSCYCPVVAVTFIFRPRLPHPAHAS